MLLLEDSDPGTRYAATSLADGGETLLLTRIAGSEYTVVMLPIAGAGDGSRPTEGPLEIWRLVSAEGSGR